MLYYKLKLYCVHCCREYEGHLVAETEPPPDTVFHPKCPNHGGPVAVIFRSFKPCDPFEPQSYHLRYPPQPDEPPAPRWWQFWKRM